MAGRPDVAKVSGPRWGGKKLLGWRARPEIPRVGHLRCAAIFLAATGVRLQSRGKLNWVGFWILCPGPPAKDFGKQGKEASGDRTARCSPSRSARKRPANNDRGRNCEE
ncbi:uncharacterized protein MYCFIDRAFT_207566 [Pseudocercospora fijiensis CIRAD86]|uniref:Uncharacterized protein n=1 Tax=Pseudocercospora fijiensis (strain CIRAD86) TaxID=383855 RepID=M3AZN0_PSEFD|nr:uncharacterized protein MYCFIDRAFT_207566 [Pseudocercospora fijiensis CIRAD86]EME82652.1 hypothetical protein MYCFIDRAFT_207566 [Pseudocercospora fijiensis CIRAD86]